MPVECDPAYSLRKSFELVGVIESGRPLLLRLLHGQDIMVHQAELTHYFPRNHLVEPEAHPLYLGDADVRVQTHPLFDGALVFLDEAIDLLRV